MSCLKGLRCSIIFRGSGLGAATWKFFSCWVSWFWIDFNRQKKDDTFSNFPSLQIPLFNTFLRIKYEEGLSFFPISPLCQHSLLLCHGNWNFCELSRCVLSKKKVSLVYCRWPIFVCHQQYYLPQILLLKLVKHKSSHPALGNIPIIIWTTQYSMKLFQLSLCNFLKLPFVKRKTWMVKSWIDHLVHEYWTNEASSLNNKATIQSPIIKENGSLNA